MAQSIQVIVRARPPVSSSTIEDANNLVVDEEKARVLVLRKKSRQHAEFQFSKVLGSSSTQQDVYAAIDIVKCVCEGVSGCVLAYGQTNTGKTFTMYGSDWQLLTQPQRTATGEDEGVSDTDEEPLDASIKHSPFHLPDNSGIIPRCINDLFDMLQEKYPEESFSVSLQMMQIYNEKVFDLMRDPKHRHPLQVRDDPHGAYTIHSQTMKGVTVPGLSVYQVSSKREAFRLLNSAFNNKISRSTEFNKTSSRSHTIVQVNVQIEEDSENGMCMVKKSSLLLVDLAGSEKWRDSLYGSTHISHTSTSLSASSSLPAAMAASNVQKEVAEMNFINSSLLNLGHVISCLVDSTSREAKAGEKGGGGGGEDWETASTASLPSSMTPSKPRHIPFRDSSLTRLLQKALHVGKTVFVVTVYSSVPSVHTHVLEDTYSTLLFANKAARVKMVFSSPPGPSRGGGQAGVITALQAELRALRQRLLSEDTGCVQCSTRAQEVEQLRGTIAQLQAENDRLRVQMAGWAKYYDVGGSTHAEGSPARAAYEVFDLTASYPTGGAGAGGLDGGVDFSPGAPSSTRAIPRSGGGSAKRRLPASLDPLDTSREGGIAFEPSGGEGDVPAATRSVSSLSGREVRVSGSGSLGGPALGSPATQRPPPSVSPPGAGALSAARPPSRQLAEVSSPVEVRAPPRSDVSGFQSTAISEGSCRKHGLASCVLCALFEASPAPLSPRPAPLPDPSSAKWWETPPPERSAAPAPAPAASRTSSLGSLLEHSPPRGAAPSDVSSTVGVTRRAPPSVLPSPSAVPAEGAACRVHRLTNCLLCAMRTSTTSPPPAAGPVAGPGEGGLSAAPAASSSGNISATWLATLADSSHSLGRSLRASATQAGEEPGAARGGQEGGQRLPLAEPGLPPPLQPIVPSQFSVSTLDSQTEDDFMRSFFHNASHASHATHSQAGQPATSQRSGDLAGWQPLSHPASHDAHLGEQAASPVIGIRRLLKAGHKVKASTQGSAQGTPFYEAAEPTQRRLGGWEARPLDSRLAPPSTVYAVSGNYGGEAGGYGLSMHREDGAGTGGILRSATSPLPRTQRLEASLLPPQGVDDQRLVLPLTHDVSRGVAVHEEDSASEESDSHPGTARSGEGGQATAEKKVLKKKKGVKKVKKGKKKAAPLPMTAAPGIVPSIPTTMVGRKGAAEGGSGLVRRTAK